jgi:hypothetical protein
MAQPAPAPMDNPQTLTINADGTWTPPYITINAGDVAKFDVNYPTTPPGLTVCTITIGSVSFSAPTEGGDTDTTGGTVKIGS